MSPQTYWMVVAPAALFGVSAIGWAWLWLTRREDDPTKAVRHR
jgi:dolichyl-phosphate-mannose--protein O-mannosyl transferase